MSLTNQPDLLVGLQNWLQRTDLNSLLVDFITLFENTANRRLRVRQQEAKVVLTPSIVATVSGAAASPVTPLIRLTVSSTTGMSNGDSGTGAAIVGTTEANAAFAIYVIDTTHIDLIGSTFTNAYVSGGTFTVVGNVALPSDYLTWRRVTWMGNPLRELAFVEPSVLTSQFPNVPQDLPSEFTIEGSVLRIMPQNPTPLTFLYWQKIPALTASAPTNWLMTAHPDLYLFGSLTEASAYAVNTDVAAMWKSRRDELFQEVETLDEKARGPSAVRVLGPTP